MTPGPLWTDEEHGRFQERLRGSSAAVFAVAYHHHRRGRLVEIPPVTISQSAADNIASTDGGDLFVTMGDKRYRNEVKHRDRAFTSAKDWPDPHVFVSNVGAVDRSPDVHAYIIVNRPMTHVAYIAASTKDQWYTIKRKPSNTSVAEEVYCCPKLSVQFIELIRP